MAFATVCGSAVVLVNSVSLCESQTLEKLQNLGFVSQSAVLGLRRSLLVGGRGDTDSLLLTIALTFATL